MARYDDDLLVGPAYGGMTMGELRRRLVIARAHSPAVGRMNPNCAAASHSEAANLNRSDSVRDYWQTERAAAHREKVREAMRANQAKSSGRGFSDHWREQQAAAMTNGQAAKASAARWGENRNQEILRAVFLYHLTQTEVAAIFCLSSSRVSRICSTVALDV
jgi:hypothetical protein